LAWCIWIRASSIWISRTIMSEPWSRRSSNRPSTLTWSLSRFDEGEWQESIAEPRTERWLWFVVANILYPMGYQADLGIGEDG
jgi:hypothetical protein